MEDDVWCHFVLVDFCRGVYGLDVSCPMGFFHEAPYLFVPHIFRPKAAGSYSTRGAPRRSDQWHGHGRADDMRSRSWTLASSTFGSSMVTQLVLDLNAMLRGYAEQDGDPPRDVLRLRALVPGGEREGRNSEHGGGSSNGGPGIVGASPWGQRGVS